jgi:hypothetical protein
LIRAHILILIITISSFSSIFHPSIELLSTYVAQTFLFIVFLSFILVT